MSGTTSDSGSFHEVQFPVGISYGAVGGPQFHTTVLSLQSGYEQRNIDWAKSRAMYDVAQNLKSQGELDQLVKFFVARQGRAYGFRFKDWTDYRMPFYKQAPGDTDPIPLQLTTNGTLSTFQLTKFYVDAAGFSYSRIINKPVAGTLVVYVNGVPANPATDFTVDTTTGIVTLSAALAATTGSLITASCQFDVPVRFDTDEMKVTLENYNNLNWGSITLVELRLQ